MARILKVLLTLSTVLLGIVIVAELIILKPQYLTGMIDTSVNTMVPTTYIDENDLPEFRLPSIRLYREIKERPLFSKDRHPSTPSQPYVNTSNQKTDFPEHLVLQAVYVTPQKRTALLFDTQNNKKLRLYDNQEILGWRIVKIESWGLILAQGAYQKILHVEKANE